ncbi:hypothetical protein BB561_001765 [Smittium simulii]|uniref:Uncharacterized protein n=1 Tax=Smittium simulii TaxID=133385 RepID=A0A2T9YT83_9FUNG|nr:hypothetical protein BB561_001765 [Smittium simulii]
MVQSFNFDAIKLFYKALLHPDLLKPTLVVKNFKHLDCKALNEKFGTEYLVFDLDNCLSKPYQNALWPEFEEAWTLCKKRYGKANMLILSNSAGTADDKEHAKAKIAEDNFGVKVLKHSNWKKPSPEARSAILDHFGLKETEARKVAVVGDRVLTDVLLANNSGFVSVLTRVPIDTVSDNIPARLVRSLEHVYIDYKYPKP